MIGRAAMGQPWLLGQISAFMAGQPYKLPSLEAQLDGLCEQIEDSLTLYGGSLGLRIVRKHIAAHIDKLDRPIDPQARRQMRADVCRIENPAELTQALASIYLGQHARVAA